MKRIFLLPILLVLCAAQDEPRKDLADRYAELAERRAEQIERLEKYRDEGRFPMNTDFEGTRVPYFVDSRGTACAVAHLMIEDGQRKKVEKIAGADNHVRVTEVQSGALVQWLLESGLLQEEAALIQPGYDFREPPEKPKPPITRKPDKDEAPTEEEIRRLRAHFTAVISQLRDQMHMSLETALRRLRKKENKRGFFVLHPPRTAKKNDRASWRLINRSSESARSRVVILDAAGGIVRDHGWSVIRSGSEQLVRHERSDVWMMVEWSAKGKTAVSPVVALRLTR